jgi:DNA-binding NarL/FixJ family response regulator
VVRLPMVEEMPAAVEGDVAVLVLGPDGVERSAVSIVLEHAGMHVIDLRDAVVNGAQGDRDDRPPDAPTVIVLVEPELSHWSLARDIEAPTVLVCRSELHGTDLAYAVLSGADDILVADEEPSRVVEIVQLVSAGGTSLEPSELRDIVEAIRSGRLVTGRPPQLTARERETLVSIANGDSVKQTARQLGISAKTVENHQGRLFRKLGARNRAEAVSRAYALGLLR